MPQNWVQDEDIWNDAVKAFKKSYDREPKDNDYKIITDIYKKMGGKIKEKVENYKDRLERLQESVKEEKLASGDKVTSVKGEKYKVIYANLTDVTLENVKTGETMKIKLKDMKGKFKGF